MNWDILYKYMQNNCSDKEIKQLQYWLQDHPANEDFFKSFVESWEEKESPEFKSNVQQAWNNFKMNRLENGQPRLSSKKINRLRKGHLTWLYAGAAAMVLVIAVFAVINKEQPKKKVSKVTYRTIFTKKGQRTNLRLKDGTQIILNAESKLRLPDQYDSISRTVYLQGEAFFDVKHNSKLPFVVISHKKYIKDLGTAFNVTAYDSSKIEVAVKKGLVSLGNIKNGKPQQPIGKLHKNNLGILGGSDEFSVSAINDMNLFSGWTQGKLVFHNTSFPEVVKRLARWFNIKAKIADPALNKRTLTATYNNMPFDEILDVLSLSLHVTYQRKKDTVIFTNKRNLN